MLFERIESAGLAHYSYLIGDQGQAVVIDPRRDCDIYLELAQRAGCRITHILETHRNEDYVIGSVELAARTGAAIWHADAQLDYRYGQAAAEGQTWGVGQYELRALSTPGHTPGSMSYLLHDPDGHPWVVFTGDALFAGDVGRVDLLGVDLMPELAAKLHASLFEKLLPLGDGVIVCPGHGAGSVCGTAIADRPWTTIGWEREHNPKLQQRKLADFVRQVAQVHASPPYFHLMERYNVEGAPLLGARPAPPLLTPAEFAQQATTCRVVDTRAADAFCAAHLPDATYLWEAALPNYIGWFVPYDAPLLLVTDPADLPAVTRHCVRLGYDTIAGVLAGGMSAWHADGRESARIERLSAPAFARRWDAGARPLILDVRSAETREAQGGLNTAQYLELTQLPALAKSLPRDRDLAIFCNSGMRATLAANLLARAGLTRLTVIAGGVQGWLRAGLEFRF